MSKSETPKFPDYLKEQFNEWTDKKLEEVTANNYRSWMNQLPNYISSEFESYPKEVKKEIKKVKFLDDYLSMINDFLKEGDRLYALSVYDKIIIIVKMIKDISVDEPNKTNWSNRHAAFVALGDFLTERNFEPVEDVENINSTRGRVPKNSLRKIDGMDALLSLKDEKGFIKMAIDGSYFFEPELVRRQSVDWDNAKARHTIDTSININYAMKPKKKENKKATYNIDGTKYEVYIDPDNNKYVRGLINEQTGVTVASGKNALIQNTIISHVWGCAYDPRYFTSLWNIVLIPAWANSLMDKEKATPGSLASKMRATFMAICTNLYKANFDPGKFHLKAFPPILQPKDILPGSYSLNMIEKKQGDAIIIKRNKQTIKTTMESSAQKVSG
jgi:hypothetical protein